MVIQSSIHNQMCGAKAGDHIAHLYDTAGSLHVAVSQFVASGLQQGEAAIVASSFHTRDGVWARLADIGCDVTPALQRAQLIWLDADDLVHQIVRGSHVDQAMFHRRIGRAVDGALAQWPGLRAFGELAHICCTQSNRPAAMALEDLWNELARGRPISLLCGYRMNHFDVRAHRGPLQEICRRHTHVLPGDDAPRFEKAVRKALVSVLGHDQTSELTHGLLQRRRDLPAMPPMGAMLLSLREILPSLADSVLIRAEENYRRSHQMTRRSEPIED